ncbi:MAG: putative glycolipid-binding domain-containing protein [Gordonia sp. (in: high G+C Gram-positive bacteria)]|uniref:putative glycolipid-binding domain-containing protein n=1 Tax=Gordonia sp. (in: high G+C Gram-positive bacteria) TaxID=84139 RepID=UPI0039E5692E
MTTDIKTMLTWRGADADRLEQVRINISGARVRAYGRIISAATDDHEAFSVSYELVTTDDGITRRLSTRMLRAGGETQLDISRDMDGRWMVQTPDTAVHSDFGGAETIDIELSPFLKTVPIRRFGLPAGKPSVEIPVVHLSLPGGEVGQVDTTYTFGDGTVDIVSPLRTSSVTVDADGLVLDYPGVASRI